MTWTAAANYPATSTITFTGTSAGGYQSGAGRYVRVCSGRAPAAGRTRLRRKPHDACRLSWASSIVHSLRYFDITSASDLNAINANIQANGGSVRTHARTVQVGAWMGPYANRIGLCGRVLVCACARTWMQLSLRLRRWCSSGATAYSSSFYGVSFPGSVLNSTTFFSLSPS